MPLVQGVVRSGCRWVMAIVVDQMASDRSWMVHSVRSVFAPPQGAEWPVRVTVERQ